MTMIMLLFKGREVKEREGEGRGGMGRGGKGREWKGGEGKGSVPEVSFFCVWKYCRLKTLHFQTKLIVYTPKSIVEMLNY